MHQESTNTSGRKKLETSPRFQKFKAAYLESGNAYQAALKAGYSKNSALAKSYLLAAKVNASVGDALRRRGVDEQAVAQKLKELFDATKKLRNPLTGQMEEFPDYPVQLGALQEIAEYLGLGVGRRDSATGQKSVVQVISAIPRPDRTLAA